MTVSIGVLVSALLCGLVAGFVLAFAVVVMPGIARLGDRDYLRAFQAIDRVIQDGQPLFLLVWLGSALVLIATAIGGIWQLAGLERALLLTATGLYLGAVQLPTVVVNIPLNNRLQQLDLDHVDPQGAEALTAFRQELDRRWLRWNTIRTVAATASTSLLLVVALRV